MRRTPRVVTGRARASFVAPAFLAAACSCGSPDAPALAERDGSPIAPIDLDREVRGHYTLTAGNWSVSTEAFSDRAVNALARVSVLATDTPVTCSRIRITQPPGHGAPLPGRAERFAVAELEIYERSDPLRYTPDASTNLARDARIVTDSEAPGYPASACIDGRLVAADADPHWRSSGERAPHWIEIHFASPAVWNQIVITWPRIDVRGPWPRDPMITEGLRPAAIEVHVRSRGVWNAPEIREITPAGRHDGAFVRELVGLDRVPASRHDHLHPLATAEPVRTTRTQTALSPAETRWRVETPPDPPRPVTIAARELAIALGSLPRDRSEPDGPRTVLIARTTDDIAGPAVTRAATAMGTTRGAHAIVVESERIVALGTGALEARYAARRLERMAHERPDALGSPGTFFWRPRVNPRIVSSVAFGEGDDLGFSDAYLSAIARGFADGILIFQNGPYMSDITTLFGSSLDAALSGDAGKTKKLSSLVARAREHDLATYWMVSLPGALSADLFTRHPGIRGSNPNPHAICLSTPEGEHFVRDAVQRLAEALPDLAGLVVLRSEYSHGCGGRLVCRHCQVVRGPDDDPAQRIFDWARETLSSAGSDIEVIAMDWRAGGLPPVDVDRLHADVAIWTRPGMRKNAPENDLRIVEPGRHLGTLLGDGSTRALFIELQLAYAFPLHTVPELAVPHLVLANWGRLLDAVDARDSGRTGVVIGNGSGFLPSPMQDLALADLAWETNAPITSLEELAARWYGPAAAGEVLSAWRHFSDGFRTHATFDKYQPRITLIHTPGEVPIQLSDADRTALDALIRAWSRGLGHFDRALAVGAPQHRNALERSHAFAAGVLSTLTSLANGARWTAAYGETTQAAIGPNPRHDVAPARALLQSELANTRRYVALISGRSEFRTHPYYRSLFSLPQVIAKQRRLEAELASNAAG